MDLASKVGRALLFFTVLMLAGIGLACFLSLYFNRADFLPQDIQEIRGKVHEGWYLNLTNSLPRGLYKPTHELIDRGTLVAECLPESWAIFGRTRGWLHKGYCPTNTPPILKKVVGIPGDIVELTDGFVAVNGIVIPNSATQKLDSQGREMPAVPRGTFILKTGELFLLATNIPNSLDSRYMGPVDLSRIICTARAVLTEGRNE